MQIEELKQIIARHRLNRQIVANLLGVALVTVNRWLQGVVDIPGYVDAYFRIFEASSAKVREDVIKDAQK